VKKLIKLLLPIFLICIMLLPFKTMALEMPKMNDYIYVANDPVNKNAQTVDEATQGWMDDYNQEQNCSGGESLLGDPGDENSVAWLLQQILNYIRIIGPILVVVLSSVDFAVVIVKNDDDSLGKAKKKLINRLLLVIALFLVPTLVSAILDIFGITGEGTCGIS
jgi:hypothetical protein